MKNVGATNTRSERRDAAENRQRILDTALKLFEENGVEQISMNQIAIAAQVGSGTLYRRYRNKSELCLDLIRDNIVQLFEDIEAYLKQHEEALPNQRLEGILSLFVQFREKKLQLLKGVEEASLGSRQQSRTRSPLYEQLHIIIVELLNEMTLNDGTQPNHTFRADMLLTALRSESYLFQRDVRGISPEVILEQLCLTFIPIIK